MKKYVRHHLDNVNSDDLLNHRKDAFCLYAQCSHVELGWNAVGSFRIRVLHDDKPMEIFDFIGSDSAIENYKKLVEKYSEK